MRQTAHEPQEPGSTEKAPASHCCCLDIKWPRLGRQPHGVFLMKSNDWTMDDGNLYVGSLQVQRGEDKGRQWKV